MPTLNYPRLDLPAAQEVGAFRAVDRIIRQDPACRAAFGRSIYSWTGDALDDAEPTWDTCPWIRLSPVPGRADWENVGQHRFPMSVAIELAAAGTRIDELMNLWGIVRAALFPQGPAQLAVVQGIIQAAGITIGLLVLPCCLDCRPATAVELLRNYPRDPRQSCGADRWTDRLGDGKPKGHHRFD
jgi:hypothetical protein